MEIKDLKEKIITEVTLSDKKDLLEEVLILLNKEKSGEIIELLRHKGKIFESDDNLFKRLS